MANRVAKVNLLPPGPPLIRASTVLATVVIGAWILLLVFTGRQIVQQAGRTAVLQSEMANQTALQALWQSRLNRLAPIRRHLALARAMAAARAAAADPAPVVRAFLAALPASAKVTKLDYAGAVIKSTVRFSSVQSGARAIDRVQHLNYLVGPVVDRVTVNPRGQVTAIFVLTISGASQQGG